MAKMTMDSSKTNYLTDTRGILSWFFSLDHKRVAVMYLTSIVALFVVGSLLALLALVGANGPDQTAVTPDIFDRAFSLHGVVMVFAVLIPSIFATVGYFLLPLMLGAGNMVFPRFTLLSFHLWALGVLLVAMSACAGGLDTGWTFLLPFAAADVRLGVTWMATGLIFIGLSTILTSLNFITTVRRRRPAAVVWTELPVLVWALEIAAWIQLAAAPIVCIFFAMLIAERAGNPRLFGLASNGDVRLFERIYWLGVHPAAFVLMVPAIGIISDLISVHSRKHLVAYPMVVASSAAMGILGFLGWGTHLFTADHLPVFNAVGSALGLLVFVPGSIIISCWLATMYRAATEMNTPMLYALAAAINLTIGGLSGLFLAIPSTGAYLHSTYFSTAHLHYLLLGGVVFALVGGVFHWWSKIAGREYSSTVGRAIWLVLFFGFHATFFPMFILGSHGLLSRRVDNAFDVFSAGPMLHGVSLIGGVLLVVGFLVLAGVLVHSMKRGKLATSVNPWGAQGSEWQTSSPPPTENFTTEPNLLGSTAGR